MSKWAKVGEWLKDNGGGLLGVVGAVATGNIPGGVAMVASMISEATGQHDPLKALERLKANPETMIKLKEIAGLEEENIRKHHREVLALELEDAQKEHEEQQKTIRIGDTAKDKYVRHTRPLIARQSWYGTMAYIIGGGVLSAFTDITVHMELALVLLGPAGAYMGFRTWDKNKRAKL